MVQLSHPYVTTGKTIALTRLIFVSKVISLLFNILSRLVIAFIPRSMRLLISQLQSPFTVILEPKKIKVCHCFYFSPINLPWSDGTGCHDHPFFERWVLSQLFFSSFIFIKRLFSSSLPSSIRVASSAYMRLLIFLLAVMIPPCDSSSPAFHMIYSAYKLDKQGDNTQSWCIPFPIWNQSVVPCPVLTVASWLANRFAGGR